MDLYIKSDDRGFKKVERSDYFTRTLDRAFGFGEYDLGHCARVRSEPNGEMKVYKVVHIIGYDDNFPGTELYLEIVEEPIIVVE